MPDKEPFANIAKDYMREVGYFNLRSQEGNPLFPVEEIETAYEGTLPQEGLDVILGETERSIPFTDEDLNQFLQIAAIYKVNPSAAEEYYNELMRHFDNRVATDPSREGARSCLEGPIQDVIKKNGFEEIIDNMGAVVRLLTNQDSLYIRINDIIIILGQYIGEGRNVGTAYVLKDGASANLKKANSPITIQEANNRLIGYMSGCNTITVPSYVPEKKTNASKAEMYQIPAMVLAFAVLASVLGSRLKHRVEGQAS